MSIDGRAELSISASLATLRLISDKRVDGRTSRHFKCALVRADATWGVPHAGAYLLPTPQLERREPRERDRGVRDRVIDRG